MVKANTFVAHRSLGCPRPCVSAPQLPGMHIHTYMYMYINTCMHVYIMSMLYLCTVLISVRKAEGQL